MSSILRDATSENALPELSSELRYLARQPIIDLHARVHGYELLFRRGPDTIFSGDGNQATLTMLDNTVIYGLEMLTGGLPAFINCIREVLTERLVDILPTGMSVLEILENIEPTPDLIASCHKLKMAGFRLALDDFVWRPGMEALVEMADYIKIDFTLTGAEERQKLIHRLSSRAIAFVAEKVETQAEYKQACDEGFTLFQGYYFCRPILMKNTAIPANRLLQVQILQLIQCDPIDMCKLGKLVKNDPSLTYRLLRLVNSPICAMRQEVHSIQSALLAVGEHTFRRVATLAIVSALNSDQPSELLRMAFVRARFCELAAGLCAMDATEQYLLGLLSLLPAMLSIPMKDLTPSLPLREEIRQALESAPNAERRFLYWLECHECGDWESCDEISGAFGLNSEQVAACYAQALVWAENAFHSNE